MSNKPRTPAVTDVQQSLALRVRQARVTMNWTRPMLATRSGVNQYTLKRFERTGEISLSDFAALCEALGGLDALKGVLKPRLRVDVNNWTVSEPDTRQRAHHKQNSDLAAQNTGVEHFG